MAVVQTMKCFSCIIPVQSTCKKCEVHDRCLTASQQKAEQTVEEMIEKVELEGNQMIVSDLFPSQVYLEGYLDVEDLLKIAISLQIINAPYNGQEEK